MDQSLSVRSQVAPAMVVESAIGRVLKDFSRVSDGELTTYHYKIKAIRSDWEVVVKPSKEAMTTLGCNGKPIRYELVNGKGKSIRSAYIQKKTGWELKLTQKVRELIAYAHSLVCPACKGDLQHKSGPTGIFLGCENFPECRYTKAIKS